MVRLPGGFMWMRYPWQQLKTNTYVVSILPFLVAEDTALKASPVKRDFKMTWSWASLSRHTISHLAFLLVCTPSPLESSVTAPWVPCENSVLNLQHHSLLFCWLRNLELFLVGGPLRLALPCFWVPVSLNGHRLRRAWQLGYLCHRWHTPASWVSMWLVLGKEHFPSMSLWHKTMDLRVVWRSRCVLGTVRDRRPWCVLCYPKWSSSDWKRLWIPQWWACSFYSGLLMFLALICSGEWARANGKAIFTTLILFV